ncbi:MAG: OFA family MFS transporter [Candidatus Aenigmatarchaeota archaeon]
MEVERKRWFLVLFGLIIMLCLGSIYAYSVISLPLKNVFESYGLKVTYTEMQIPYMVFLFLFAITMPLVGKYIEKYGPRKIAFIGAIFVGLGWFLASFAKSPFELILFYGVIGGFGVGLTYNCPIVVSARWFPDKRGLAVGLTLLGFGFSAALIAPFIDFLISSFNISIALKILGIMFFVLIAISASFLSFPSKNWKPKGLKEFKKEVKTIELKMEEMIRTKTFYILWFSYVIGTLAGLMAIGVSKPVGLEVASNKEISSFLTMLITIFAFFNGIGRPLFGWLTDKISPRGAAILSFSLISFASILMYVNKTSLMAYAISFSILWLNLGGWLAIAPATTAKFFGTKDYARNYGVVFTAYGVGAIVGNVLVGQVKDIFGSYIMVFPYVLALALFGLILANYLKSCAS